MHLCVHQRLTDARDMDTCMLRHCPLRGEHIEQSFDLTALFRESGVLVVGRDESEADICLSNSALPLLISRRQAELKLSTADGLPRLEILDSSTNGTCVLRGRSDWQRLRRGEPKALQDGDVVAFGGGQTVYRHTNVRYTSPKTIPHPPPPPTHLPIHTGAGGGVSPVYALSMCLANAGAS